jgi:hypothetical protein
VHNPVAASPTRTGSAIQPSATTYATGRPTVTRNSRACERYAKIPPMSLLTELDAFFSDHRQWGDLDADVDGPIVWIACDCGARMARRVDEADDAGRA